MKSIGRRSSPPPSWHSAVLVVCLLAVCLNSYTMLHHIALEGSSSSSGPGAYGDLPSSTTRGASPYGYFVNDGPATALPSVRISESEEVDRKFYGGKGDKPHLGGFTSFDPNGVSPTLWRHMVSKLGIKSILDVGCGRGISTSWFVLHGLEYVACVEGSHDAMGQSLIPTIPKGRVPEGTEVEMTEHDFSRGPWWPRRTVDAVWCVEFTEHVGRNFQPNYLTAFQKAGIIFMTHSLWGGWHHVEVHDKEWWIVRMQSMGFVYSEFLTRQARQIAMEDKNRRDLVAEMAKYSEEQKVSFNVGQHLWGTLHVFLNPLVLSRHEHAHLYSEHGCNHPQRGREQECGKAGLGDGVEMNTALPPKYKAIPITKEMDDNWLDLIRDIPLPKN